jgi:urea-proton symporter
LAIFAVPWGLGTVIGLAARVIHTLPIFPTYPKPLTVVEVFSGLVMPYTIKALLGDGALIGFLLLVFMALTSTISSSMIAVSSILSYDLYKTYFNPGALDKQIVRMSHIGVVFHAFFISGFSLVLNYGGANINWLAYFLPILTCPGIMPLIFTLFWSGQSKPAAVVSPLLGLASGIAVWLSTAHSLYGELNITTTQAQAPCLYGALTSLFSPAIYSIIISYFTPTQFDWNIFLNIRPVEDLSSGDSSSVLSTEAAKPEENEKEGTSANIQAVAGEIPVPVSTKDADEAGLTVVSYPLTNPTGGSDVTEFEHPFDEETLRNLRRWYKIAWAMLVFIILITFVAWPLPLYRDWIFSKSFFAGWTTVAIIWQFFAFFAVVVYPLWDGRWVITKGFQGVKNSLASRSRS